MDRSYGWLLPEIIKADVDEILRLYIYISIISKKCKKKAFDEGKVLKLVHV
jgi:hypothetical protein